MREVRQYAFVHFLASALTQTSNVPKAITQADLAMTAFDQRFPGGEDREVVDLRANVTRFNNQIAELEADKKRLAGNLHDVMIASEKFDERIAAVTAERDAALAAVEGARPGSGT